MSDRELSTRDLAETPEADAERSDQPDAASEPLARERAADEPVADSSGETSPERTEAASTDHEQGPLLSEEQAADFTRRWDEIQVEFVDEPRDSVAQADTLVADLMQQLAAGFSGERERLEKQWDSGEDVSTEDLRVALTRYRSFFDRLLSA